MSTSLESGSRLGQFELLAQIGQGGMATVWVARGPVPGSPGERLIAIKAILPELAKEERFRRMFLEEGRLIQSIAHPHVVRVFHVGQHEQTLFLAMEWVEGESLHALIAEANKRRPIPPEMAVRLIADTAAGLHAAHEVRDEAGRLRGIVHCDVSPHNILIGIQSGVKLVDFGVASAVSQLGDESQNLQGKFAYMSPEQTRALPLDRRSDVFSLGIVLFELTTGYRLFKADTPAQAIELVRNAAIPSPQELRPDYPKALQVIVLKALKRDVKSRYQTAADLQKALEKFLVDERILVPSAGVSGLLKRVLGEQITEQRTKIRAALAALRGEEDALLQTLQPVQSATSTPHPTKSDILPTTKKRPRTAAWLAAAALATAIGFFTWSKGLPVTPQVEQATASALPTVKLEPLSPQDDTQETQVIDIDKVPSAVPAMALTALPKAEFDEDVNRDSEVAPDALGSSRGSRGSKSRVGPQETKRSPRHSPEAFLRGAVARAARCGSPGKPTGAGRIKLSVTSGGKVVSTVVSAPFGGTPVGACVARAFKDLELGSGKARILSRTFRVR